MKNKTIAALAALVLLFGGFTGGFFLGRNTRVGTIQTTRTVYATVPPETVIVLQEVYVTLPQNTESPAQTVPPAPTDTAAPKPAQSTGTNAKEPEVSFPVNINTASLQELDALPGIGQVLGQRIIDYRSAHGPFSSVDGLLEVKGIGEKKLADLKPYATV